MLGPLQPLYIVVAARSLTQLLLYSIHQLSLQHQSYLVTPFMPPSTSSRSHLGCFQTPPSRALIPVECLYALLSNTSCVLVEVEVSATGGL